MNFSGICDFAAEQFFLSPDGIELTAIIHTKSCTKMAIRVPPSLLRAAPRTSLQSGRNSLPARGVATKAGAGPSSSSSSRWVLTATTALVGAGAGVYALQARSPPIHLEGRKLWSERMKPKESKGDASLRQEAQARHPEPEAEAADETPQAIEVAVEEVEEDAGQQSAYNPDTGEINWDCPCLGGMADGPCGEQFKAAFSCFVYSEAEPKGIDCVDKFKLMQDCFREHPDIYKDEIEDDEAASEDFEAQEQAAASSEDKEH